MVRVLSLIFVLGLFSFSLAGQITAVMSVSAEVKETKEDNKKKLEKDKKEKKDKKHTEQESGN
ncbi:hypothetical protein [Persephonella sp.]